MPHTIRLNPAHDNIQEPDLYLRLLIVMIPYHPSLVHLPLVLEAWVHLVKWAQASFQAPTLVEGWLSRTQMSFTA